MLKGLSSFVCGKKKVKLFYFLFDTAIDKRNKSVYISTRTKHTLNGDKTMTMIGLGEANHINLARAYSFIHQTEVILSDDNFELGVYVELKAHRLDAPGEGKREYMKGRWYCWVEVADSADEKEVEAAVRERMKEFDIEMS